MTFTPDWQAHAANAMEIAYDFTQHDEWKNFRGKWSHGQVALYDFWNQMALVVSEWENAHDNWWDDAPNSWDETCEAFVHEVIMYFFAHIEEPDKNQLTVFFQKAATA